MYLVPIAFYAYLITALGASVNIFWRLFNGHTSFRLWWAILLLFFIGSILIALYAHLIAPYRVVVRHLHLPNKNKKSLRIALIADLQVGDHKRTRWIEKVCALILRNKPDALCIAGDLVNNEYGTADESVHLAPLGKLIAHFPVFSVLGNHDYIVGRRGTWYEKFRPDVHQQVLQRLAQLHLPMLRNELVLTKIQGQPIVIFGADDMWGSQVDFTALNAWDQTTPLILLTHNPDVILSWPRHLPRPHLVLAGHTHGGQVALPFFGPLGNAEIKLPKKFYRGLQWWGDTPVLITTGLGESNMALRFFARPEIVILHL